MSRSYLTGRSSSPRLSDMNITSPRTALFGPYAIDLRSGELRKFGIKVKMGEQAFQILRMLLENPGEMVTREELRAKLWATDTFVDFDHGLNSAVQRLRDCLSDSAGKPRWVETIPRRGYRFVGQVEWSDQSLSSEIVIRPITENEDERSDPEAPIPVGVGPSETSRGAKHFGPRIAVLAVVSLLLFLAAVPLVRRIQGRPSARQALPIKSLAVLPLENLSGDPAQEYFADGMTDEVITVLAKNPALRVTSRTSVMQYKKVHRPLREIAQELGVDGILEGSVGRSGNRVHVTAQLIHAASDTHVWADSFDRDLSDVGSLQTQLAEAIAKQVGATASVSGKPDKKIKPEAHDAYLLGRYYWLAGDYGKSREYFQKAIDLEPTYAAAWGGLADSHTASVAIGSFRPDAVMPQAEAAARKALELDDSDDEAHRAAAAIQFFYRWDWEVAERESARAVELNPGFSENHHLRAYVLSALNRTDESLQEDRKAMELDSFVRPWALGYALLRARQFDAAVDELRIRSEAQPNDAWLHGVLSEAYLHKGMEKEAEQESEQSMRLNDAQQLADEQHQIYIRSGFPAVLEWKLNRYKRSAAKRYISPIEFAEVYAQLKRKEETLRYLELAYKEHAPFIAHIQCNAHFDFVHSDPRYRAIVKKMGLPPAS
jgi:TolB-like protein/DNA-binding winged helix-turn-helix (wHTH) protein/predicted Zn-dependent protease